MSEMEVPKGWAFPSLESLIELIMGQAPSGDSYNKNQSGTVLVKVGEFGTIFPEKLVWTTKPLKFAKNGDVLLCVVGATIGKINLGIDCAIGRSVASLRPNSKLLQKYLYYFLMSKMNDIRNSQKGSAQGVITKSDIFEINIPLPSINKQKIIVQKLDYILGQIEGKKKEILSAKPFGSSKKLSLSSIAHLINLGFSGELTKNWREKNENISSDELIQITFPNNNEKILKNSQKLRSQFESKGIRIPQEWLWVTVDDLFNIVMGQSPSGLSYNKLKKGVPLLNGPTEFTEIHPIPLKFTSEPTKICKTNDLLICVRGNTTGKMNWADQPYCIGRGLAAITPKNPQFNIDLLYYFLNQKTSEILLRTAGSTFPNLSQDKLKSFPYPLASTQEQLQILKEIEHRISKFDKISKLLYSVEEKQKEYSRYLDSIQKSVLNFAFSGKLVN